MAIKKSDLYSSLWASCDELRGGMDATVDSASSVGLNGHIDGTLSGYSSLDVVDAKSIPNDLINYVFPYVVLEPTPDQH